LIVLLLDYCSRTKRNAFVATFSKRATLTNSEHSLMFFSLLMQLPLRYHGDDDVVSRLTRDRSLSIPSFSAFPVSFTWFVVAAAAFAVVMATVYVIARLYVESSSSSSSTATKTMTWLSNELYCRPQYRQATDLLLIMHSKRLLLTQNMSTCVVG